MPVSDKPSLCSCYGTIKKGKERSPDAERESMRRTGIREVYEELSKFYELPGEGRTWKCPRLLPNGKLAYDHSTL